MCIGSNSTISTKKLTAQAAKALFATNFVNSKLQAFPKAIQAVDRVSQYPPIHTTTTPVTTSKATVDNSKVASAEADQLKKVSKKVKFACTPACNDEHDMPPQPEEQVEIIAFLTPSSCMTELDRRDIYWQDGDYELFKGTARMISSEIRRRGGEDGGAYGQTVNIAYEVCSSHKKDNDYPLGRGDQFYYLAHWCRVGHSRRGLERWSIEQHAAERQASREAAIKAVIEEQGRQKRKNSFDSNSLRKVSESYSRSARMFALALGQADEAAVFCPPDTAFKRMTENPTIQKSTPKHHRSTRVSHAAGIGAGLDADSMDYASIIPKRMGAGLDPRDVATCSPLHEEMTRFECE